MRKRLKDFLLAYTPDKQQEICRNRDNCYFGDFPTLGKVNRMFGPKAAEMWLTPQLTDVAVYSNSQKVMDKGLAKECASVIVSNYFYLKISEMMLFFQMFKAGHYGQFYGSVSPLVITKSLRMFLADRGDAISDYESRRRAEQEKRRSTGRVLMSREEYLKLKARLGKNGKN